MLEKIFKDQNPVKEAGFEYYNLYEHFDVSINFIQEGVKIPPHSHEQEVYNYVFEGDFSVFANGTTIIYSSGEWINIPAGVLHAVETKTKVTLLELWKK